MPPRQNDLPLSANAQPSPRAPSPIVVQRDSRPAGEPLSLTPQNAPRAATAPSGPAVIERQPYPAQPYPAYAPPSPNRPVPPGSVPQAKLGADAVVTGSVEKRRYFKETPILKSRLPAATPEED
jgi:hypothetical protein